MLNKISIRVRVTLITVLLLTICCVGLTIVLNKSAYEMTESIKIRPGLPVPNEDSWEYFNDEIKRETLMWELENSKLLISEEEIPYQIAQDAKGRYKTNSLYYTILFITLGGVTTYFIMGKTLNPLKELSRQMKNKSVKNLYKEIPLNDKKDEIYELTVSFNEMTNKLNQAFDMQKGFSHSVAHELRTPLTIMRTRVDVFRKRRNPTTTEYEALVESMRNQLIRLSDIVNSLLSLTNMDDIDLSQDIKLKNLLELICIDLSTIKKEKNIQILIEGKECEIKGNYDLMYRAFYNLIENSIKYNEDNGTIKVILEQGEKIKVIIKDSGIGIPDNMKENVFEPFFTVDKSRSRKLGGAGIGLSIVKSVIDKHNSTIVITDNKPKGSIFTIEISDKQE
ncbi:MAG: HAMP domain-containing sensor histidine kinase [Clostridium sp.]